MKLNSTVAECLKELAGQRLRARDIATWMFERYPEACADKKRRSAVINTDVELIQQLVAEIGANRPAIQSRHPQVRTTEGRPRLYYWSEATEEAEVATAEALVPTSIERPDGDRESDLYPKLTTFLWSEFQVFSRRIDEKTASNRRGPQGNHWLFPDLVGMEDLTAGWAQEVRDCVSQAAAQKARLWSFEVKLLLNRSNVREAYFQTVSNSSWAHFGYLVAADIQGAETAKELRMLSALHGIGVCVPACNRDPVSGVIGA